MVDIEKAKEARRVRDRRARETLADGYIRKLIKEQMRRGSSPVLSKDIPHEYLEFRRAALIFKRAFWGRPVDVPDRKEQG